MSFLIYTGPRRVDKTPLHLLMAVNACFAFLVLFAWAATAMLVAEPISWATWMALDYGSNPEPLDYPYVLLWAMPTGGAAIAWLASQFRHYSLAYFAVSIPIICLGLIFCYFYFVPIEFH